MKQKTESPNPAKKETEENQTLQLKRKRTNPRQKFPQRIRGFLPLNLEKFLEKLPSSQPISRTHHRPGPQQ